MSMLRGMEKTMLREVFASAAVDDVLVVGVEGKKGRRVTVTRRVWPYLFVSSGKVRPGHRSGGSLRLDADDGQIWYQPTLQQQIRPVATLAVVA